ncbi:fibronectin type III-like domain-contianing protein [Synechococcus sp. RedBA-s]|uniref:fibronectin type III-like domain-contianing protein n=1 Tax=Synechococcus sp. RedBA-s TaxID=2823741 RepID=UPI0020CC2810|nr:fibronectin type III-like domain-contianing protein [Synechococcus sp. RedBA-s]
MIQARALKLQASVTITNTGNVEAAEVVQLYPEPPARKVERPARTLVAFQRLLLTAGEARRITLAIQLRACATFDPAQDGFVTEEGLHRLVVARLALRMPPGRASPASGIQGFQIRIPSHRS